MCCEWSKAFDPDDGRHFSSCTVTRPTCEHPQSYEVCVCGPTSIASQSNTAVHCEHLDRSTNVQLNIIYISNGGVRAPDAESSIIGGPNSLLSPRPKYSPHAHYLHWNYWIYSKQRRPALPLSIFKSLLPLRCVCRVDNISSPNIYSTPLISFFCRAECYSVSYYFWTQGHCYCLDAALHS